MASKIEVEVELKSGLEKIWESIRESTTLFPKALPELYQSIEVLEGDGKSVGSVRLVKYPPGPSPITSTKEKMEVVDEEKKTVTYSVIDEEFSKYFNNFKATLTVIPKGSDGSSVKWSAEFEKTTEEVTQPDFMKEFVVKNFQDLDAYLLKA